MSTIHPYRPDRKYWPYDIAIELGAIPLAEPPPPITSWTFAVNFRDTAGYVTDGAGETYCLNENYPVSRAGFTFGFTDGLGGDRTRDRDSGIDRRLAGGHFTNSSGSQDRVLVFRVDLPTAGDYRIKLAVGDAFNTRTNQKVEIFDDSSSLGVLVNDASTAGGHWVDATNVERTSSSDWVSNNAWSSTLTFSSTTCIVKIGTTNTASDNTFLGHLTVDLIPPAGDATVTPSVLSISALVQAPAPNILSFPSALVAAAAVQAATPIVIQLPAVLSPAAAAQAPAALADCLVSPAVLSILASAQAPTPAVLISPAVLSAAAAVQAPTVDTGSGNITASPAVLSIVASIQAPDKSVTTLPSALIAQASAPAPVVVLTLAPQALLAQASIQAPSPGIAATPAALSAQAATQAPGKEIRTLPGPAVAAASAIPAGASWAITAFPAVVSAYANLVAPTVTIGGPITDVSAIIVRARQRSFSAEARPRALSSGARRRGFGVDSQG